MASGFMHNIKASIEEGWENPLQPIIVVHDSNTNFCPISKFFDLKKFYDVNYTEYCMNNMGDVKICLLFDLLIGTTYDKAETIKQIDDNTIEITGNANSLIDLYDRLMRFPDLIQVECSVKREELVPQYITNPIERFILEKGTSIIKDLSNYTIQFYKVN